MVHGPGNIQEMPEEFGRRLLIHFVGLGQFQRHAQHIYRKHGHPTCRIGLLHSANALGHVIAIENPNVVQTQKSTFKKIGAMFIFLVYPPSKIDK
jgi:hypothetical protein